MISTRGPFAPMMFHDEDGEPFDEILVKQCFKEESDINNIVAKFHRTGTLPVAVTQGVYGDFSEIGTYQDALIKIQEADEMFSSLPAHIRAKFDNSTSKFLDFVDNPDNVSEMLSMGLITDDGINQSAESVKTDSIPTEALVV